jgi:hypothetical protein
MAPSNTIFYARPSARSGSGAAFPVTFASKRNTNSFSGKKSSPSITHTISTDPLFNIC